MDSAHGSAAPASSAGWPVIGTLGLSDEQRIARAGGIGGSDANIILSGDRDKLVALWSEKRGEAEPADSPA